jgi:hypothetical protein
MKNRMPLPYGFISIVALWGEFESHFIRDKAISISNATCSLLMLMSSCSRNNPRYRIGFLLSPCGSHSHLPKGSSGPVASYHITRMFHEDHLLFRASTEPVLTDGKTKSVLATLESTPQDPQWITGFIFFILIKKTEGDGEGCFNISA